MFDGTTVHDDFDHHSAGTGDPHMLEMPSCSRRRRRFFFKACCNAYARPHCCRLGKLYVSDADILIIDSTVNEVAAAVTEIGTPIANALDPGAVASVSLRGLGQPDIGS